MSKISELSNGGALLSTDDLIVVRSGGNVRAQLSAISGQSVSATTLAASGATTLSSTLAVTGTTTISGNVGVGTNSPSSYFAPQLVVQSSTSSGGITIRSNSTTDTNYLVFADGTSGNERYRGYISYDHNTDTMKIATGASPAITISSSKNVGIGTTSPISLTGNATPGLTVSSNGPFILLQDANNADKVTYISNNTGDLQFGIVGDDGATGKTEHMRIDELGRVGIGIAPSSKLEVNGGSDGSVVFSGRSDGGNGNNQRFNLIAFADGGGSGYGGGLKIQTRSSSNVFSDAVTVSSAGSVGIGVSNPSDYYANNLVVGAGSEGGITIASSATTYNNYLAFADSSSGVARYAGLISYDHNIDVMHFRTNSLESMRINSAGVLCVGVTGPTNPSSKIAIGLPTNAIAIETRPSNGNGYYGAIFYAQGGGAAGYIFVSASSTTFSTSSDYRLKENVVGITDATQRLLQLKPSRFNFIADADTTVDGFLAHEVQDIVPEAITGTKDAVDADGNPEYQGIDQSKLVPLLVATIQELEARLTALENN